MYLSATTAFVRSALTAGDAVLVAVPGPKLSLMRDALAAAARFNQPLPAVPASAHRLPYAGESARAAARSASGEPGLVVCQVDDGGHVAGPLLGRTVPVVRTEGGRGLLPADQLCDLFRMHTGREGTSIRLHMAS